MLMIRGLRLQPEFPLRKWKPVRRWPARQNKDLESFATAARSGTALKRFGTDQRGIAAIEFAMILPLLVTIYLGTAELTRVIDASRRVSLFARTLADLSGRADNPTPSAADMATIAGAATAILRPLDASGLRIVVSAMGVENVGGALYGGVCSSWQQNAAARPRLTVNGTNGLPATPSVYQFDGARYILAEVTMTYVPFLGSEVYKRIFGIRGVVFVRQIPWAQRTTAEIVMPGGSACPKYN